MKIIHLGDKDNYIQCPGQCRGLQHFESAVIKDVYIFFKALVKLLDLPIKSYTIKKLLLNERMVAWSKIVGTRQELLSKVIMQPEVANIFAEKCDMEKILEAVKKDVHALMSGLPLFTWS